ncbi:MAG: hypothetical protein JWN32_3951 [Solirubrobacterales bacterium]|nr:hypothetical protein [Solirubrobacterales bacterium]
MAASARTGLSRPVRLALILLGVVVFVAISFALARILSASGAERSAVVSVIEAQAKGDTAGVVRQLDGCAASAACRAAAARNVARLRRPGNVQVLNFAASTGFGIANTRGRARIAWRVPGRAPVVQCVEVHRDGNPISGLSVHLIAVSAPIRSDASCP